MSELFILRKKPSTNAYAEKQGKTPWEVAYACMNCVNHYPTDSKETIALVGNRFEGTRHYEAVWLNSCKCPLDCDTDFQEGDYVYFMNMYWKLVGTKLYEYCGCIDVKLTLERLTPRETDNSLIECVSCYKPV